MLVQGDHRITLGGVAPETRCDLGLVDDLLRFQLLAKRFGRSLIITDARADLRDLFEMVGLVDLVEG